MEEIRLKNVSRRGLAVLLAIVTALTGVLTNLVLPTSSTVEAEAATVEDHAYGTDIVNEALKYLGYGYSQSSRKGDNGTFDCSGLVYTVLTNLGFSNVPDTTADWQSQISSGTLALSYSGYLVDDIGYKGVVYASSLSDLQDKSEDPDYSGYAIVLKNTVSSDTLQSAGLPAGSIVITEDHAMIVMGDYSDQMPTSITSANFGTSYWTYYNNVITQMSSQFSNLTDSVIDNAHFIGDVSSYTGISGSSTNHIDGQVYGWPTTAAFTTRQSYWMMVNSTANAGSLSLGSSTWVIDAASTSYGVRITNKIGSKDGGSSPSYVVVINTTEEETRKGTVNIEKVSQSGSAVSGATFTIYSDAACTSRVATMTANGSGTYTWSIEWEASEGDTKTYYIKETTVPSGYTADTNSSGEEAMWRVVINGKTQTTTYYKRYGSSGSWTTVRSAASSSYYMTVTNTKTTTHTFYKTFGDSYTEDAITSITVQLYQNGTAYGDAVTITSSSTVSGTSWAYQWSDLPEYDSSGTAYKYHVEETRVTYTLGSTSYTLSGSSNINNYFTVSSTNTGSSVSSTTTITNTLIRLYGAISVSKVNSENETVTISGVQYGVYSDASCTNLIETITTNSSGVATYTVDDPWFKIEGTTKTVYIKEISTVSPYILDDTVYTVVITGSSSGASSSTCRVSANSSTIGTSIKSYTQTNDEQYGQITVTKMGEVVTGFSGTTLTGSEGVITGYTNGTFTYTYQKMSGATFAVYAVGSISNQAGTITYSDGELVTTGTTSSDGTVTFSGLPLGTYRIVETSAPDGQTLNTTSYTVTLSYAGQSESITTQSLTVSNDLADASVSIVKIDEDTSYGLEGAFYGLYAAEDITNSLGDTIVTAGTLISVVKTDSSGSGTFLNGNGDNIDLPYGSYYIKEIQTRDGYILSDETYSFTFSFVSQTTYTTSFSKTFTNERMSASIDIAKVDRDTGEATAQGDASLDGAVYYLYAAEDIVHPDGHTGVIYSAGDYVATLTTANGGTASVSGLYLGKYYVQEITPPEGYLLDTNTYTLDVTSDGTNHVATSIGAYKNTEVISASTTVSDEVIKRAFAIMKVSGAAGDTYLEGLNGAGFTVYLKSTLIYKSDGTIDYENSPKMVITADGQTEAFTANVYASDGELLYAGYLETIALPYGEYLVHESTVPENSATVADFTVTISDKDAETNSDGVPIANKTSVQSYKYLIDYDFTAKLKIVKRDATTGENIAIAGATFKIYDLDNECYIGYYTLDSNSQKVYVDTWTTNSEGYVITEQALEAGNYRIEEIQAPEGYYNAETAEGITSSITVTIGTGYVFESDTVEEFYDADLDCYILPVVYYDEAVTGTIEVYKEGEVLSSYNAETGEFVWTTVRLSGAQYAVYAAEDIYTPDNQTDESGNRNTIYTAGELVGYITTGSDGTATMEGLPLGTYKIVEVKAPEGYLLGDTESTAQYATLAYDGQNVKVVYDSDGTENGFNNPRPTANITITKYERSEDGTVTDTALAGTTYNFITTTDITNYLGEVIVTAGTVLATVTTGEDGTATVPDIDMPYGSYAFIEISSTPGYVIDDTPILVTYAYGDQYTATVSVASAQANDYTKVEFLKVDSETGEAVVGATLTVYAANEDGSKGDVIATWVTDGSAYRIDRMVPGTYILEETQAPTESGYVKAADITFTVTETSEIQTITMEDDHTTLIINKTDFVTESDLAGAVLQLITEDGEVYAEWTSKEGGETFTYVPVGTYILREISSPDGYEISEDVIVTVTETSEIQYAEMIDYRTPEITSTTLTDAATGTDMVAYGEEVVLVDVIAYKYLIPGREYTVTGTLYDKETGEALTDADGNVITATTTFIPTSKTDGIVENVFVLDSTVLAGKTLVAFEEITYGGESIAIHADLEDAGQTVIVPEIGTTATDTATGDHVGSLGEEVVIEDVVEYDNLIAGEEYTVTGTIYLKSSGEALTDADGNVYTASLTFVAEEASESVTLTFTVDTTVLAGETIVFFEELTHNGVVIAIHADIDDEAQSVYVPEIGTTAIDIATGDHVGSLGEEVVIEDVVEYNNLIAGEEYTVTGTLMDKATGEPLTDRYGHVYTATTTFTPEETSGSVTLSFTVDTTELVGQTIVVFEELTHNDVTVAIHADLEDAEQSVYIPAIGTLATDLATGIHLTSYGEETIIEDVVTYDNLIIGQEYTLTGTLYDKETSEPLTDTDGNIYTSTTTFTAETVSGSISVFFTVDTTVLEGQTLVAFEDLTHNEVTVAVHADIDDEDQSVYVPEIGTTAIDIATGDHVGSLGEEVVIEDVVEYNNLIAGEEYTVTGTLYLKSTGEALTDTDGNVYTSTLTFVAEETSGSVTLTFTVDTTVLAGETIVVFEELTHNDVTIAVHADIDDEDQSVYIPKISTLLTDITTGTHQTAYGTTTLQDVVTYYNLIAGEEYTLTGTLINKTTGEAIATSSTTFVAEETSGTVAVTFTVDLSELTGKSIVAFEELTHNGVIVATHTDLEDENQTVDVPKTGTLTIYKVDQDGNAMGAGVEFLLTNVDTGEEYTLTTGEDSTVTIDGLPIGYVDSDGEWVYYTYTLQETKTLEGYRLDETVYTFSFTDEGTDAEAVFMSFTVKNVILGIEDFSMMAGGVLLLAAAGLLVTANKKRKECEDLDSLTE